MVTICWGKLLIDQNAADLRAELDALYAHLYDLTRDELAYILDTFPIVRSASRGRGALGGPSVRRSGWCWRSMRSWNH
jgi:hypothetical protein